MIEALAEVTPVVPEGDPIELVSKIVEAASSGNWRLVAAFALVLTMMVLGRFRKKIPIFDGDRGGSILVMVLSLGGGLSTALMTDMPINANLVVGVVGTAFTAVGGFTWVRKIMWPQDKKKA
jgi:hypothetical protein